MKVLAQILGRINFKSRNYIAYEFIRRATTGIIYPGWSLIFDTIGADNSNSLDKDIPPLSRALNRLIKNSMHYEAFTYEILREPDWWFRDASLVDITRLLSDFINRIPSPLYLKLLRLVSSKYPETVNGFSALLEKARISENWELIIGIAKTMLIFNVTLNSKSLNKLLKLALKSSDPNHFLSIYSFFEASKTKRDMSTYRLILLFYSRFPNSRNTMKNLSITKKRAMENVEPLNFLSSIFHEGLNQDSITKSEIIPVSDEATPLSIEVLAGEVGSLEDFNRLIGKFDNKTPPSLEIIERLLTCPWTRTNSFNFDPMIEVFTTWWTLSEDVFAILISKFYSETRYLCQLLGKVYQPKILSIITNVYAKLAINLEKLDDEIFPNPQALTFQGILLSLFQRAQKERLFPSSLLILRTYFSYGYQFNLPPSSFKSFIQGCLKTGQSKAILSLFEELTIQSPSLLPNSCWRVLGHELFAHGLSKSTLKILENANRKKEFSPEIVIHLNLLLQGDGKRLQEFCENHLFRLANTNALALKAALQGLIRRRQYILARKIFQKCDSSLKDDIEALSLVVQACSLQNDKVAAFEHLLRLKNTNQDAFGKIKNLLHMLNSGETLESTIEFRSIGLAILYFSLVDRRGSNIGFRELFFRLFDSGLEPTLEDCRSYISVLGQQKLKLPLGWGPNFFGWLSKHQLAANNSIWSSLAHLACKLKDKDLCKFVFEQVLSPSNQLGITKSLLKELSNCAIECELGNVNVIEKVLKLADENNITLDSKFYTIAINASIKLDIPERALFFLDHAHKKNIKLEDKSVGELMTKIYKTRLLVSFIPILERCHRYGYLADPSIYKDFLVEHVKNKRLSPALENYKMLLRCKNALLNINTVFDLINLCIHESQIQKAHVIFSHALNKSRIKDMTFSQYLEEKLDSFLPENPKILEQVPPSRILQAGGEIELIQFAISRRLLLSSRWCHRTIENALLLDDLKLARQIHQYICQNNIPWNTNFAHRLAELMYKAGPH